MKSTDLEVLRVKTRGLLNFWNVEKNCVFEWYFIIKICLRVMLLRKHCFYLKIHPPVVKYNDKLTFKITKASWSNKWKKLTWNWGSWMRSEPQQYQLFWLWFSRCPVQWVGSLLHLDGQDHPRSWKERILFM